MPSQDLIFVGFSSFKGKKDTTKTYFKLQFISIPTKTRDGKSAYYKTIDLFVDSSIYDSFIEDNALLDTVSIPYEISGDKVIFKLG